VQEVQFVKSFKKGIQVNMVSMDIKLWCSLVTVKLIYNTAVGIAWSPAGRPTQI